MGLVSAMGACSGGWWQGNTETPTIEPLPGWVDNGEVVAGAPPNDQVEWAPLLYLQEREPSVSQVLDTAAAGSGVTVRGHGGEAQHVVKGQVPSWGYGADLWGGWVACRERGATEEASQQDVRVSG